MFQLQPVGTVAHIQICGTTSCMICGAEDLIRVCKEKISAHAHELSADGRFSWEEVECLGACANAPMAQIGKDYYEDLTAEKLEALIDSFANGEVPQVGPQNGRFASEPKKGLTSLEDQKGGNEYNASVTLANDIGDTLKRIQGDEVPIYTKWQREALKGEDGTVQQGGVGSEGAETPEPVAAEATPDPRKGDELSDKAKATADKGDTSLEGTRPEGLEKARDGKADDLKLIKGVGPALEELLNSLGFWHFDQIAAWSDAELAWVDDNLEGFKGRASRDEWIEQAKKLAHGQETEFSKRAKDDGLYD